MLLKKRNGFLFIIMTANSRVRRLAEAMILIRQNKQSNSRHTLSLIPYEIIIINKKLKLSFYCGI